MGKFLVCNFFTCSKSVQYTLLLKLLLKKDMSMTPAWIALILLVISIVGRSVANYYSQLQQCHASYFMVANKRVAIGEMLKKYLWDSLMKIILVKSLEFLQLFLEDVENTAAMVMVNTLSGFINTIIFTIMILAFEWRIGLIVTIGCLLYLLILSKMENKSRNVLPKRQVASAKLVDTIFRTNRWNGCYKILQFNRERR